MNTQPLLMILAALLFASCGPPVAVRIEAPDVTFSETGYGGPHLLLADGSSGQVLALDLGGRVLARYTLPEPVAGVSHDRTRTGFWVCHPGEASPSGESLEAPVLAHYDWQGMLLTEVAVGRYRGCRGLDVFIDPEHGVITSFITTNVNDIDVVVMTRAGEGERLSETGSHADGVFRNHFWGHSVIAESGDGYSDKLRWNARNGDMGATLEKWDGPSLNRAFSVETGALRGLAQAGPERFYVIDALSRTILELVETPSGFSLVSSIPAPTLDPAGLSYSE